MSSNSSSPMLARVLKAAVLRGATDVHAKAGDVFRARVGNELVPLTRQRLTPQQTRALAAMLVNIDVDDPAPRHHARLRLLVGNGRRRPLPHQCAAPALVVHDDPARDSLLGTDARRARPSGCGDAVRGRLERPRAGRGSRCVGEDVDDRGHGASHQSQPAAPCR